MEHYDKILQAIYDAIGELNEQLQPQEALEKSPETVLIGEAAKIDSVNFINFAVTVEQNVENAVGETISVMDIVADDDRETWTVATLSKRIAERLDQFARH